MDFSLDWLAFTVPLVSMPAILAVMPGGLTELEHGWRGYSCSGLVAGGKGLVGWSPDRPDMGCHVSLSSQALSILVQLDSNFQDLCGFVAFIQNGLGGHLTRADFAWDDREGVLDLVQVKAAIRARSFTSRWRGGQRIEGWGTQAGETEYIGSPLSKMRVRIYDKALEQKVSGHWIRVELQARDDRADYLAAVFSQSASDRPGVLAEFAGVLRGYLEFKEPAVADSNRSRWVPAGWWLEFLDYAVKACIPVVREVRTLGDVQDWISRQVSPSLALLVEGLGFEAAWAWLYNESELGKERLSVVHRAILAALSSPVSVL